MQSIVKKSMTLLLKIIPCEYNFNLSCISNFLLLFAILPNKSCRTLSLFKPRLLNFLFYVAGKVWAGAAVLPVKSNYDDYNYYF